MVIGFHLLSNLFSMVLITHSAFEMPERHVHIRVILTVDISDLLLEMTTCISFIRVSF